jgi:hypothetical protein
VKKNARKLRLHRETLVVLDREALGKPRGAATEMDMTSCTYACACPTGCSEEQICIDRDA